MLKVGVIPDSCEDTDLPQRCQLTSPDSVTAVGLGAFETIGVTSAQNIPVPKVVIIITAILAPFHTNHFVNLPYKRDTICFHEAQPARSKKDTVPGSQLNERPPVHLNELAIPCSPPIASRGLVQC